MKYPMTASIDKEFAHPYIFRFDLVDSAEYHAPKDQIPHLKGIVNNWLKEHEIDYIYRTGLQWCLRNEQDAVLFTLRWS